MKHILPKRGWFNGFSVTNVSEIEFKITSVIKILLLLIIGTMQLFAIAGRT
jgi:hypothetical protein